MVKSPTASKSQSHDPAFEAVVRAFSKHPEVSPPGEGKGFGSGALKVKGKMFALLSSKGHFVAKLPKDRVEALVRSGHGSYFEPSPGRLMKEWVEVKAATRTWVGLAKEAYRFVRGA